MKRGPGFQWLSLSALLLLSALLALVGALGFSTHAIGQSAPGPENPGPESLQRVVGVPADLAIGIDGTVYALDSDGSPWVQKLGSKGRWGSLPGKFRSIRTGLDGSVYALTPDDHLYRFSGSGWTRTDIQGLRDLAVTPDGIIYTLTRDALVVAAGAQRLPQGVLGTVDASRYGRILVDEHGLPWLWSADGALTRFDGVKWVSLGAFSSTGIASMSAGIDGTLLAIDGGGRAHRWNSAASLWEMDSTQLRFRSAAVGPYGKVWYVTSSGEILAAQIYSNEERIELDKVPSLFTRLLTWKRVRGTAQNLTVGIDGTVITVDGENNAWQWKGTDTWTLMPGKLRRAITSGSGEGWGIDIHGQVVRYRSGYWVDVGVRASDIAVGPKQEVWALDWEGRVGQYQRALNTWSELPDIRAKAIAVGKDGEPWVIDGGGLVQSFDGATWKGYPGIEATTMSVGPEGTVYATTALLELFWLDKREGVWKPATGRARAVAVGPDGAPWIIGEKSEVFASVDSLRGINGRVDARATALTEPPRAVFFVLPPLASVLPTSLKPLTYTTLAGSYADIGIGADGSVFAAGTDGALYCFSNPEKRFQLATPGTVTKVAVSPGGVPWVVNINGQVSFFDRSGWVQVPDFKASDIAFGSDGATYAAEAARFKVYKYAAATRSFAELTSFSEGVALQAKKIAFSAGALWAVTPSNQLLLCRATRCQAQTIGAVDIASGPEASVFALDLFGAVRRWNPRTGAFAVAGGSGAALSVGPQGLPWLAATSGAALASGFFSLNNKGVNAADCASRFVGRPVPLIAEPAQLTAGNDSFALTPGSSASLLANDRVNGIPPNPGTVDIAFYSASPYLSHSEGIVTVHPGAPPGVVLTGSYTLCNRPSGTPCSRASVNVLVPALNTAVANANADTATLSPGGGFNLLANDTLNGVTPTAAQVSVVFQSTSPYLSQAGGVVNLGAGAPAGSVQTASYSICPIAGGGPCSSTVAVRINVPVVVPVPLIAVANADTATLSPGGSFNLLANDTLNGVTPTAAQVSVVFQTTSPYLSQAGGVVTLGAGAPAGSVQTAGYSICPIAGGGPCSSTVAVRINVNVVVPVPLIAVANADTATLSPGGSFNLLANDTLNGVTPTAAQVSVVFQSTSPYLSQAGGVVTLGAGAPAGSVQPANYSICPIAGGGPCSSTVAVRINVPVVVPVPLVAVANADTATLSPGGGFNLLANDTLNGVTPTAAQVSVVFQSTSPYLSQAGGVITLGAGAPAGSVQPANYSICPIAGGNPCSSTVAVRIRLPTTIIARPDGPYVFSQASQPAGQDLSTNDTLNGAPIRAAQAVYQGSHSSFSISPYGFITPIRLLTLEAYTVDYTVCEINVPTNCASSTASFRISK